MAEKLTIHENGDIGAKIHTVRGQRIILDFDLAEIYGVPTKRLNEQVKRNKNRFPTDFMFKITSQEWEALKSQIMISNASMRSQFATASKRNVRYFPYAFTEHGAAMAANVLNSPRAIEMSLFIVRAFIRLRQMLLGNKELRQEIEEMKRQTNDRFQVVFETLDHLLALDEKPKRKIGFTAKEKHARYAVKPQA